MWKSAAGRGRAQKMDLAMNTFSVALVIGVGATGAIMLGQASNAISKTDTHRDSLIIAPPPSPPPATGRRLSQEDLYSGTEFALTKAERGIFSELAQREHERASVNRFR